MPTSRQIVIPFEQTNNVLDGVLQRMEDRAIASGIPASSQGKPIPNDLLRSALFAVSSRIFRRETMVASVSGVEVYIARGYRPTQSHLDVWERCLSLAAEQGTGKTIRFSAYSFLRSIDRSPSGGSDRKWLNDALLDLAGCLIRVTNGKRTYFGPLISGGTKDETTDEYCIEINPRLAVLFMGNNWTAINAAERRALRRHPLAQWLHAFFSTHDKPYRHKVETIRSLCGSDTEELWKFRQTLKQAMIKVSKTTGWLCEIDDNDCLVIEKSKPLLIQQKQGTE